MIEIILWSIAAVAYLYVGVRLYLVLKRDSITTINAPAILCVVLLPMCLVGLMILGAMALRWHHWFAKVDPRRIADFIHLARTKNTKHIDQIKYLKRTIARLEKEIDNGQEESKRLSKAMATKALNHAWLEAVGAGRDAMAAVFMKKLQEGISDE